MKIGIFEKMTAQDAFLTQPDPIWAPKRTSKEAQDESKMDPKRVQNRAQNRSEKMIEKWTAQGSMPRFDLHTFGPWMPTGGVRGDPENKTNTQDLAHQWASLRYAR